MAARAVKRTGLAHHPGIGVSCQGLLPFHPLERHLQLALFIHMQEGLDIQDSSHGSCSC